LARYAWFRQDCGNIIGKQKDTYNFIENEVKKNHGPLGKLYPQDYVSEGDSPAFLYSIANGLRNHENPTYGGWGGRFEKFDKFENVYVDAEDDGNDIQFNWWQYKDAGSYDGLVELQNSKNANLYFVAPM